MAEKSLETRVMKPKQQIIMEIRQRFPNAEAALLDLIRILERASAAGTPLPRRFADNAMMWLLSAFADPRTRVEGENMVVDERDIAEDHDGFMFVSNEGSFRINRDTQRRLDAALAKTTDGHFEFLPVAGSMPQ
jgi:hypothetical protein